MKLAGSILSRYEKVLVPVLLAVSVTLATALAFVWWQVLSVKPASKPGDFLKIDKTFTTTPLPTK